MYQAYDNELLNQKESKMADSGPISDKISMADKQQHPLYVATRRLVKALDRLEGNLKQVSVSQDREVKKESQILLFEKENTELKQERESLNNAIAQLQHQYNDLHKIAATIYGKLDDSIKRLTQIIEE